MILKHWITFKKFYCIDLSRKKGAKYMYFKNIHKLNLWRTINNCAIEKILCVGYVGYVLFLAC